MSESKGNLDFKLPPGMEHPLVDFYSINTHRIKYLCFLFLYIFGLLIFMYGMLPQGHTRTQPPPIEIDSHLSEMTPKVDRLVLMLVDGLRADALLSDEGKKEWSTLYSHIDQLSGLCGLSHIQAPSVTLPRLRAILSGQVPTFTDVLENLNAVELRDDNWLTRTIESRRRKENKNWPVEFYGDNTWLKLFPSTFSRSEGTHSFFVNDFYEVDTNVTRHLPDVLAYGSKWNGLILHYLGLDHIGHVEGPNGSSVASKLREMDRVVKMILHSLVHSEPYSKENWLFVLTGDHGTADRGGHGGATHSELTTGLVMVGSPSLLPQEAKPTCKTDLKKLNQSEQVDLSVLFGLLTGSGIPASSIGSLPLDWLQAFWRQPVDQVKTVASQLAHVAHLSGCGGASGSKRSLLSTGRAVDPDCQSKHLTKSEMSLLNAFWQQIDSLLACFRSTNPGEESRCTSKTTNLEQLISQAQLFVQKVQHAAVSRTGLVHETAIIIGCLLMWLVTGFLWFKISLQFIWDVPRVVRSHIQLRGSGSWLALSCSSCRFLCGVCTIFIILQAVSLGGSSYSEEEHQLWYYFSSNLLVLLAAMFVLDRSRVFGKRLVLTGIVGILLIDRLLRRLHSTGYQMLNAPDLAQWLYTPSHIAWLWGSQVFIWSLLITLRLLAVVYSFDNNTYESRRHRAIRWSPVLSGGLVAVTQLIYRYTVTAAMNTASIYTARLAYLALLIDLGSTYAWRQSNVFTTSGPQATLRAFWFDLVHPVNVFPLLICLLGRPAIGLLWIGVVVKEFACANLVRVFWDRCDHLPYVPSRFGFMCVWLLYWIQGWVTFFQQGNSSSLASIDVSAGYVGLTSYQASLVGFLVALHTYAGPLYWQLAFLVRFLTQPFERPTAYEHACFRLGCIILPSTVCATVCYLLQSHISIWTVYTPKMFYLAACHAILAPVLLVWGSKIA